jgi:glucose-6-phosphate isomerase
MSELTRDPAWRALNAHARKLASTALNRLFAADTERAERFSLGAAGLHLDYSKQRITRQTMELLLRLAEARQLGAWIERLFAGEAVNHTEGRAALHVALRNAGNGPMYAAGRDVMPEVRSVLDRMFAFAERVRSGSWLGYGRTRITDVVNIGIGGSDLGPRMVCEALAAHADGPRLHFISNVDGAPLARLLQQLQPRSTLFVVTSKTFTTQETMANARAARRWLTAAGGDAAVAAHFVAVSTNRAETQNFGIVPENVFEFWDWVGGRYSLWSAVGLSIVLAIGPERFRALLAGAHAMDQHFRSAPLVKNLPVLMGLLSVWNVNFLGASSQVVAAYAQQLEKFVPWLQQLEMESNGKGVTRDGGALRYASTPVLWGDVGTNAQHAFFQMLHQGPAVHPVDFILPIEAGHELGEQHRMLIANCLAQSAALMRGKSAETVRAELRARGVSGKELRAAVPHRTFPGNRPSNTLLLAKLDPGHLGSLLALYEHRTFVQSVIWDINAFDQWGVELGKQLAQDVLTAIEKPRAAARLDASTRALLKRIRP